jgi:hypothetical protein
MTEASHRTAAEVTGVMAFEISRMLADLHLACGDAEAAAKASEAITDAVIEAAGDSWLGLVVTSGMVNAFKAGMSEAVASATSEAAAPSARTVVEGIGVLTVELCFRLGALHLALGDTKAAADVARTVPIAVLKAAGALRPVLADVMQARLRDRAAELEEAERRR